MAKFLLHLRPDGKPVGVYTATEHYYDPAEKHTERHVRMVREKPSAIRSFEEWANRLADRSVPSRRLMRWAVVDHRAATLKKVLDDLQDRWRPLDTP